MATTFSASCSTTSNCNLHYPKTFNIHSSISHQFIKNSLQIFPRGLKLPSNNQRIKAVNGERIFKTTSWDEKPYEVLPNGKKSYLDEQDVVTFLDPPKDLIPLDPSTYNPASYLWKKISEIPEERRHRLLYLFNPRLISAAWEAAGTRYDDAKLAEMSSSSVLSAKNDALSLEFWNCRKSGGPIPLALISHLQKALFRANGKIYGRLIGRHPRPFNDQVVIYVRHVGPGVMVGQAWQEGIALEQVPKKLCGEILMVKDYSTSSADSR